MKTALVLSAGGMFGAYQAGAWQVLSEAWQPDIVVGASAGALNAWAIAGGCSGQELAGRWLELGAAGQCRWKWPRSALGGVVDTSPLEREVERMYHSYRPQREIGIVLTDLLRLRPAVFRNDAITARHLVGSCAVFGVFPQPNINGRIYSDGGLLDAVPLWAAAEMGARVAVVVNVLPKLPSAAVRAVVHGFRAAARFRPKLPPDLQVIRIVPTGPLGNVREAIRWDRDRAAEWIRRGRDDAGCFKHSLSKLFEA